MTYRLTKTERIARRRLIWNIWRASEDNFPMDEIRAEVPDAWNLIEQDIDCEEPKEKVTLYLDRSVAKAFRAMGKGYQARVNRILRTWLQLKFSGMMKVEAALSKRNQEALDREKEYPVRQWPGWGEFVDIKSQESKEE